MDSSSDFSSSWDAAHEDPEAAIVAHWPDGTAITEAQLRAPVDPRELISDRRRYQREQRWARRYSRMGHVLRSPRGVIAALLAAAMVAASVFAALGAVR